MNLSLSRRRGGFSLVELMVSVVIGLLALLFATRLVVSGEQNKDAAVGGSDSMQNGMLALFSLSSDATEAGWGLNDPMLAGCDTVFSDANGYALPTMQRNGANFTPLAAAVIQSNGQDPDVISFNSGTSQAGAGSVKLFADYTVGNTLTIDNRNPYAFNDGDVMVMAPLTPGSGQCTLFQLSGFGAAPNSTILVNSGGRYRYNPIAGLPLPYKQNLAYIYNLGAPAQLHFHTWTVANGVLLLRAAELAGAERAGVSVTDNVVSIKAQYGFDARLPGPKAYDPNPGADGMQVTRWSGTMVDADSDGVVGSPGDYQRIAAVRIAVVARSKNTEKPNSAGQCGATTVLPTVFATSVPTGVAAVPVQVNVAVAGDVVPWQCYRYRVFETIVQIRNSQWRP
ncbi:prepilin-type N-terminal cleavage/methylation domain-containing protein [Rugamonas sp. FT107W]|uniref:Prepilin-type N-terminal cleavage/methylation domain-containing protein n=1 Tax=Duganella vulcania TaxID=2692166 RepID=A0A845HRC8_9BURK|nr:PilW family protein [Duganella vulcania]MYN18976.1 prepilin-type N-terminal cleavage/methylation domain-containing protein [Duganella vulcania]